MTHQPTSLIIAERKSAWASWVERFRADAPNVVVVLQERDEKINHFAVRVRDKLNELVAENRAPEWAVLVGGGRVDRDALEARSLELRAIATEMAKSGGGRVLLEDAGPDRFSMAALATTVQMMVRGTSVTVAHTTGPVTRAA
ncbi:MAG: hypothetical protein DRJ42_08800 [Deltaproteobacteria bacterium]|nr:MAG: hypothetical protein DRJ42_08800 [Deltaproteobacteria bacterium]